MESKGYMGPTAVCFVAATSQDGKPIFATTICAGGLGSGRVVMPF